LSHFRIGGNVLSCIRSFFSNRLQNVKIGNDLSSYRKVKSGVPQRSAIGPLLFIIYVDDITKSLSPKVSAKVYADDLKAYVGMGDEQDGLNIFPTNLLSINNWASTLQLPISGPKSYYMHIKILVKTNPVFRLSNSERVKVTKIKDLGLIFNNHLSFTHHITSIIGKAKQHTYLLSKCFLTKDPTSLILAYKTYILPFFDYCSPIWSPNTIGYIKRIESVQRMFTKKLLTFSNLSYSELLSKACMVSFELRRAHADLILCLKIVHGFLNINMTNCF